MSIYPKVNVHHLLLHSTYNDMLYLCEKYAPLDSLEKYDPKMDVTVTGAYEPFVVNQLT